MQYSTVKKSETVGSFRLDAECYKEEYVSAIHMISALRSTTLGNEVSKFCKGIFDIKAESYSDSGIPFVRIGNLKDGLIDSSNIVYIPESEHVKHNKSALIKGDIVLSKTAYPAASFVDLEDCNTSQDTIAVRLKEQSQIESEYLVVFLNTKYGKNQMGRWFTGNVQMHLNLSDSRGIVIPISTRGFQEKIRFLFSDAAFLRLQSTQKMNQAEHLLLSELGLVDWQPKHDLTFIGNFSATQRVDRFDADYFQPQYGKIVESIKSYPGGWDTLGNLFTVKKCVEVGSKEYLSEGIPFVRVSNLSPFGITEEKYISENTYAEVKQHQPVKGEILLSKDGTPGIAFYLSDHPRKMIPSNGILRLKSSTDRVNNEFMTLVLNSVLVKKQVDRDVGGSVILHWRVDQVRGTMIPMLSKSKQDQIRQKIVESSYILKQSRHLLRCAIRATETAIEKDEKQASDWLDKNADYV